MKAWHLATACLLVAVSIGATWSVAHGTGEKDGAERQETYAPTVEEWLQVWTNANFGRNDGRRTIQFLVMPGEKTVRMMTMVTASQEAQRTDPGLRQKLSMEADSFEAQVKGYAKRFGFDLRRQDLPNP